MIRKVTKTLWYAVDIDGSGWLHEDKPTREYIYMEWRCDNLHHCPEDLMLDRSIFPPLTWEDEPVEIPPLGQFIKDVYSRKDEYGNKFKYFVFKIEDLANALGECRLREFFDITERYNEYRANHRGKAPGKYWVINRDEVPEIKSFEEFKKKVTE